PKPGAIPNFAKPGYSVEDFAVVVKYVVKEMLPHFQETFKSGYWGKLGRNRGVYNISGSRTGLVFQLPKLALYQIELHPDAPKYYNGWRGKKQSLFSITAGVFVPAGGLLIVLAMKYFQSPKGAFSTPAMA
ncbi:MAG: hypothetical protein ACI3W5_00685, partial [Faecousia sp.]